MKLREETDLEALNSALVGVVQETMQPAYDSLVALRARTDREALARSGKVTNQISRSRALVRRIAQKGCLARRRDAMRRCMGLQDMAQLIHRVAEEAHHGTSG
jgi:hypothetical protein